MDPSSLQPYVGYFISAAAGGFAAYMAIRLDIAVLKTRMDHAFNLIGKNEVETNEAHSRINALRRHEPDSRL